MQMIGNSLPNNVSLYFHIPFCKRKCDYCHFYVIPENESSKEKLLQSFILEWQLRLPFLKNKQIYSIYFGGGTPSLFGPEKIKHVLEMIKNSVPVHHDAEITLEANPENISLELMQAYAKAGINRVSIGIQTLNTELLHLLGRLHNPETALRAVYNVHDSGIKNISIDLMYDLPKQTLTHWESTLKQIKDLPITHLSLYNLTIEPHTLFFKNQKQLQPLLPNEVESLAMYEMAVSILESYNLNQYEISAFAKENYEAQHNSGYWTARPFLGFGPSAFSYWDQKRFRNICHLEKYAKMLQNNQYPIDFEEQLDIEAHRRELFVIQLRLCRGVNKLEFQQAHGPLDKLTLTSLERLMNEGFLVEKSNLIKLTGKGILFYDFIASELI